MSKTTRGKNNVDMRLAEEIEGLTDGVQGCSKDIGIGGQRYGVNGGQE